MTRTSPARSLALLVAAEAAAFGPFLGGLGFYIDDWIFLSITAGPDGIIGAMRRLASGGFWVRPAELLHYPLLGALGGYHPSFYAAVGLGFKAFEGVLLFLLLQRLWGKGTPALAAAALAVLHPSRAAAHLWYANSPQAVAACLALGSLLLHETWSRKRGGWRLATAQALYLAGVAEYESVAFLPLLLGAVLSIRRRLEGARSRDCWAPLLGLYPFALSLAASLLWMWVLAPAWLDIENQKRFHLTAAQFFQTYERALSCLTWRAAWLSWKTAGLLWKDPGPWTLAAAGALGLGFAACPAETASRRESFAAARLAAATAAALFIVAYLPFAAGGYSPDIFGPLSRVNGIGAWAGACLAAAGAEVLGALRPWLRRAAWGALAAAFLCADWHAGLQWTSSWRVQQEILAKCAARAHALEPGATVLLADVPVFIGGVPLFTESWGFELALKHAARRDDIAGRILSRRVSFGTEGMRETAAAGQIRDLPTVPYGNLLLYRYASDSWERVTPASPVTSAYRLD